MSEYSKTKDEISDNHECNFIDIINKIKALTLVRVSHSQH